MKKLHTLLMDAGEEGMDILCNNEQDGARHWKAHMEKNMNDEKYWD